MDDIISVNCKCGCDDGFVFRFDFEEEYGYVTVSSVASVFYERQDGPLRILMNRIKAAWFMLCGKEYRLHEIVLSKKQWDEFVETVNKI